MKRLNFVNIQNSSTVASNGADIIPYRTGYEQVLIGRVDPLYGSVAEANGEVHDVNDKFLRIVYTNGTMKTYELGIKHGVVSGTTVRHNLVTDLKVGDKVTELDPIVWNDGFFKRDPFNPQSVSYKTGVLSKVVWWESSDTIEDGAVVGRTMIEKLKTPTAYCKTIIVPFDTAIHNLVNIGDNVEHDSILCTLEEAVSAGLTQADPEAIALLQQLSNANPKAKTHGVISNIEIIYYGEIEDMHQSLQEIVKVADRRRSNMSSTLDNSSARTGKIDEAIHFGGVKLQQNNLGIKIYIDSELPIVSGDKLVFGNALKSTVSRVDMNGIFTESGIEVDAIFGYLSIANRIVGSPEKTGTMNILLKAASKQMVNDYKGR